MTTHKVPNPIRPMIYTAGLAMLTVIGLATAKSLHLIDGELVKRGGGVVFGALLVVLGNILPKLTLPPSAMEGHSGRVTISERVTGWIFVLAGIAYMVAWTVAPLNEGTLMASLIGLSAFALALIIWLTAGSATLRGLKELTSPTLAARRVLFHMLHAVFWCFAMFMGVSLWGKDVMAWMAAGFTLTQSLLAVCLTERKSPPHIAP